MECKLEIDIFYVYTNDLTAVELECKIAPNLIFKVSYDMATQNYCTLFFTFRSFQLVWNFNLLRCGTEIPPHAHLPI